MTEGLETRLEQAFRDRSERLTPETLRYRAIRPPHSSRVRSALAASASVVAIVIGISLAAHVGGTGTLGPSDPASSPSGASPPAVVCPDLVGLGLAGVPYGSLRAGASDRLVPDTPVQATVCRYAGLNAAQPLALVRSATSDSETADLALALNTTPRLKAVGNSHCPLDLGASEIVIFRYSAGPPVMVKIALGGCRPVSNGPFATTIAASASTILENLVGSQANT